MHYASAAENAKHKVTSILLTIKIIHLKQNNNNLKKKTKI